MKEIQYIYIYTKRETAAAQTHNDAAAIERERESYIYTVVYILEKEISKSTERKKRKKCI